MTRRNHGKEQEVVKLKKIKDLSTTRRLLKRNSQWIWKLRNLHKRLLRKINPSNKEIFVSSSLCLSRIKIKKALKIRVGDHLLAKAQVMNMNPNKNHMVVLNRIRNL